MTQSTNLATITADVTVTVGQGGDYDYINDALAFLQNEGIAYKSLGYKVVVKVLPNYLTYLGADVFEQVIVNGIDLSWITITTDLVRVNIPNIDKFTLLDSGYRPVFAAINGGKLPAFNKANFSTANVSVAAFMLFCADGAGSSINLVFSIFNSSSAFVANNGGSIVCNAIGSSGVTFKRSASFTTGDYNMFIIGNGSTAVLNQAIISNENTGLGQAIFVVGNNSKLVLSQCKFTDSRTDARNTSIVASGSSSIAINYSTLALNTNQTAGKFQSQNGSTISIVNSKVTTASGSGHDLEVSNGGVITVDSSTTGINSCNIPINTFNAHGIVYKA